MTLAINHNLMADNTARNLNTHYGNLATSTQRLSSGLRINSAADDAAGLAIRELMRADIAALNQGVRNANDAISMIQVVDGALGVIDEKLIRMKELAEQAATGTYDSTQRLMIDSEFQTMASEIQRIATSTNFNGIKLINGIYEEDNVNKEYIDNKINSSVKIENKYINLLHGDGSKEVYLDEIKTNTIITEYNVNEYYFYNNDLYKKNSHYSEAEIYEQKTNYFITNQIYSATNWFVWGNEPSFNCEIINSNIFNELGNGTIVYDVFNNYPIIDLTYRYEDDMSNYSDSNRYNYKHNIWTFYIDLNKDNKEDILINMFTQHYVGQDQFNNNEIRANQLQFNIGNQIIEKQIVTSQVTEEVIKCDKIPEELRKKCLIHFGSENTKSKDYYHIDNTDCTLRGLGIDKISIETQDKAQGALAEIDKAVAIKDQARAYYGAMQNRLENTVSNLTIQAENLQASESRISDVDVATEMTNFVRNQILTQSAVAMLSQANSMPQMAMQLIGG